MRAHLVEVPTPALDQHLRLRPRAEPFQRQALVPELAVEARRGVFFRNCRRSSR